MIMMMSEDHGLAVPGEKTAHVAKSPSLGFSQLVAPSALGGSHHSRDLSESLQLTPPAAPSFIPSAPSRGLSAAQSSLVCPHPTGGEWRLKYERAVREVDFTKKRLQQEFEDKLEVEQQNRRQLERRVSLEEGVAGCAWEERGEAARGSVPHVGPGNGRSQAGPGSNREGLTRLPLGSGDNQRQTIVKSVLGSLDDPDFMPHPHISPSFTHFLLLTSSTNTAGPLNGC